MSATQTRPSILYNPFAAARPVEPSARWIRVKFGGTFIADSRQARLLIQYGPGRLPTYYFPPGDVRQDLLEPASGTDPEGEMNFWNVKVGNQVAENAAWTYRDPPPELAELEGYFAFDFDRLDAWYEEEAQMLGHARDPHKRVDVLPSSRHVRIVVASETVAESRRPHLLFETGLPTRYYLSPEDVRQDLLEPSSRQTVCPYKGTASYWSVRAGDQVAENIVWSYLDPLPECPRIKGLLSFFDEMVDVYVDGELQPRPATPWSR